MQDACGFISHESRRLHGFASASLLWMRRQRIVAGLGVHLEPRPMHPHFDGAVITAYGCASFVAEGVLIARLRGKPAVGPLNGIFSEFGKHLARRRRYILAQDVAISESRNPQASELLI